DRKYPVADEIKPDSECQQRHDSNGTSKTVEAIDQVERVCYNDNGEIGNQVADDFRQLIDTKQSVKCFNPEVEEEYYKRRGHNLAHKFDHGFQRHKVIADTYEENYKQRYEYKFDITPLLNICPDK